jgi:pyruvate/2-oxoglutarate dehydrogenase complex dihydrolipoamide dehydrogenase (E3) component
MIPQMNLLKPDICVIGAGSGGLSIAAAAAAFGVSVVLIEKGEMGGDCLNAGCVPSKALIAAAERAASLADFEAFGLGPLVAQANYARVKTHIEGVIAAIAPNDSVERFAALGVIVIRGSASFVDRGAVEAGGKLIKARRFVIATGSRPLLPPIPGLADLPVLTNETVFGLTRRPERLLVIGGGPIGCELAQAHRRLGAEVTILEAARVLPREDEEAAGVVRRKLISEGVDIREGARILRAEARGKGGLALVLAGPDDMEEIVSGSHVLVAAGRKAVTDGLKLEAAGVSTDGRGITVDAGLRTSNRRIYAIGDCASGATGGLQFTHVANYHAGLVLRSALFRLPVKLDNRTIPRVTYTDPEIASVGLSEEEARKAQSGVQTLRWPFAENDRAQAERRTEGHIKVIASAKGLVLGATIVGKGAGELVTPWTLAIRHGLKLRDMAGVVIPYPTFSEVSRRAAITSFTPLTTKPALRRLIGFLRRFG